jgi:hypothetical protein
VEGRWQYLVVLKEAKNESFLTFIHPGRNVIYPFEKLHFSPQAFHRGVVTARG